MGARCKAQNYPKLSVPPQRLLFGSKKYVQSFCHAIARLATWWTHCCSDFDMQICWLKNILQVIQLYTWKQIESMQRGRGTNLGSQPVTLKKSQHLWGGDKMHEKALSSDIPSAGLPGFLSSFLPLITFFSDAHFRTTSIAYVILHFFRHSSGIPSVTWFGTLSRIYSNLFIWNTSWNTIWHCSQRCLTYSLFLFDVLFSIFSFIFLTIFWTGSV